VAGEQEFGRGATQVAGIQEEARQEGDNRKELLSRSKLKFTRSSSSSEDLPLLTVRLGGGERGREKQDGRNVSIGGSTRHKQRESRKKKERNKRETSRGKEEIPLFGSCPPRASEEVILFEDRTSAWDIQGGERREISGVEAGDVRGRAAARPTFFSLPTNGDYRSKK